MSNEINLHENDFSDLRTRFDDDYKLAMLIEMVLSDPDTKKKYEFPVALNDAMTFMDRCVAILGADKIGYEITGGDRKQKLDVTVAHELEEVFKYWLYRNDQRLIRSGNAPLMNDGNWYNLYRGWMSSLWLLYRVGDKFIPSAVHGDPRSATWLFSSKGLKQFSYRNTMDRYSAEEMFKDSPGIKQITALPKDKKLIDLRCIWTDKEELVYQSLYNNTGIGIKGDYLKKKEHGFGICPGVVTFSPGQPASMSSAESYSKKFSRQGESIMCPNRRIYPMLDRVASLLASIMQQGWKSPVALFSDNEEGFEKEPGKAGNIAQFGKEDKLSPWPFRDLSQALTYFNGLLTSDKQKGGLSDINYGQIQFQVASLVVAQLKDDRDGIFVPRRMQNKVHYSQGFEIYRHMVANDKYYEVDESQVNKDDAIEIDKSLFKDKFVISINYTSISPEENITNYTLANQAEKYIPIDEILANILHHPDPKGALEKLQLQQAHAVVPGLREFDMRMATAPGSLTEEKKQEIRGLLIDRYLDGILSQPPEGQTMPATVGIASQPKPEIGPSSPEKLSQKKLNQTGQMDTINAKRSSGG